MGGLPTFGGSSQASLRDQDADNDGYQRRSAEDLTVVVIASVL